MSQNLSTYFLYLSGGCILILIFAGIRHLFREKYAEGVSRLPEKNRERMLKSDLSMVRLFKILLWASPLYVVLFPILVYFYDKSLTAMIAMSMVLFAVTIGQEFVFRKWLIDRIESTKEKN